LHKKIVPLAVQWKVYVFIQLVSLASREGKQTAPPIGITRVTALAFVGLGTLAIIAATLEHRLILQKIQRNDFTSSHRTSLALIVACFLCGIGLFAFLGLVIKAYLGGG